MTAHPNTRLSNLNRLTKPLASLFIAITLLAWTAVFQPVAAATSAIINVTTTDDAIANDGACSLREAITATNTDTRVYTAAGECGAGNGADIINVAAGTYVLTLVGAGENGNATGDLDIQGELTLRSQNGDIVVIDGNATDRVLDVRGSGNLTLERITIQNGSANRGGGLQNNGTSQIVDSTVKNSASSGAGGGIDSDGPITIVGSTINNNVAQANGGGLLLGRGFSTIINSTISGNVSGDRGGGIGAFGVPMLISHSTIHQNNSFWGDSLFYTQGGGAVLTITITNSILKECSTNSSSLFNFVTTYSLVKDGSCGASSTSSNLTGFPSLNDLADNGGLTQTHLPLFSSRVIDAGDGANCETDDQRGIVHPQLGGCDMGAVEASCADYYPEYPAGSTTTLNRAISCFNAETTPGTSIINFTQNIDLQVASLLIDNDTAGVDLDIKGNDFALDGNNAQRGLTIATDTDVTIEALTIRNGFTAGDGGGIFNEGTLTVSNSTISGNSADSEGGGIFNAFYGKLTVSNSTLSANSAQFFGGGIYSTDTLTVSNSTLSANSAQASGGGIFSFYATTIVTNSTLSANSAQDNGGGISALGVTIVTNSTLSDNSATIGGGGIYNNGPITVTNSIVANSAGGNDCSGTITSGGHNIASDASCAFSSTGDLNSTDPLLGPLADNGPSTGSGGAGSTFTHALLPGSPAIDAVITPAVGITTDQRGVARPFGAASDIGAFEFRVPADCPASPWEISSTSALNTAIACFNATTITGTYTISFTSDITLTAATTIISNTVAGVDLLIAGNDFALDGNNAQRGLTIAANSDVTIADLTIQDGQTGQNGDGTGESGAAIFNEGTLSLTNTMLISNSAGSANSGNGVPGGDGGAIYNSGTLTISQSTLTGNQGGVGGINTNTNASGRGGDGGAIFNSGTLAVDTTTFDNNRAGTGGFDQNRGETGRGGDGGAIFSSGQLSLDTVDFTGNAAGESGSDVGAGNPDGNTGRGGDGGAVYSSGVLTASMTTFDGNAAGDSSDDADSGSSGPGGGGGGLYISSGGTALLSDSTLRNNSAGDSGDEVNSGNSGTGGHGGAIYVAVDATLTLTNTMVLSNSTGLAGTEASAGSLGIAGSGGGIYSAGMLNVTNSSVSQNDTSYEGGGLYVLTGTVSIHTSTVDANTASTDGRDGGGIFNLGVLTVTASTISNNSANDDGGGINNQSDMQIVNSTISGNSATGANTGGIHNTGTLTLTHVSIISNTRGLFVNNNVAAQASISNTLVAYNTVNCSIGGAATFTADGGSIADDATCTDFTQVTDALVGSLGNNGGSTETHALLPGSPAIDAVMTPAVGITTDQRGTMRPIGVAHDVGAFEAAYDCSAQPWLANSTSSLNDAIGCFNAATITGTHTISFTSDITLTVATTPIDNATADVALLIAGNGFVLDADGVGRGIDIASGSDVTIEALTIQNGAETSQGGGVRNLGTLTLRNSAVLSSTVDGFSDGFGAGIFNDGTLTVYSSTIRGNQATPGAVATNSTDGGGIVNRGAASFYDSVIEGNSADFGGGIFNRSTLVLSNTVVTSNTARSDGSGLFNALGTVTISNSQLISNTSDSSGGGIYNADAGVVTVADSSISGNDAGVRGGGIRSSGTLTVTDSGISNNTGRDSGGIENRHDAEMHLLRTSVVDNIATSGTGGMFNRGSAEIIDSTIANNSGQGAGGISNDSDMLIENSTISSNDCSSCGSRGGGAAGGIHNNGTLTLTHASVISNASGLYHEWGASVQTSISNTLFANNGINCGNAGSSTFMAGSDSISDDATCTAFTQVTDAFIGPLADNGGATETHALLSDSPAIDAVMTPAVGITTDQRGSMRPLDGNGDAVARMDVGAYEGGTVGPITYTISGGADVTEGDSGTVNMTFTVTRSQSVNTGSVDVTLGGTAAAGDDYSGTAGTLSFPVGTTSQSVTLAVAGDTDVEADETVTATLSNVVNGVIVDGSISGSILNDDTDLTPDVVNDDQNEGDTGITLFTFVVTRTGNVSGPNSAEFTVTGSGTNPADADDFGGTLPSGIVNFDAGETMQTVTITVTGDTTVEDDETFNVTFNNPARSIEISPSVLVGTIRNDDSATVNIADVSGAENGGNQTVAITLSAAADVAVTVTVATADSSATTVDSDYVALSQEVVFAAGETAKSAEITITPDSIVEADETYTLKLSNLDANGRNITLGYSSGEGTIENDDSATVTLSGGTTVAEGDSGDTTNVIFTATLDAQVVGGVTVSYTIDGTQTGTLVFDGTLNEQETFMVMVTGDTVVEADYDITAALVALTSNSDVAANATNQVTSVDDDDTDLTPDVVNDDQDEGDSGATAFTFVVTRTGDVSGPNSAEFTVSGSGTNPANADDFGGTFPTGSVSFSAGETSQTVAINVLGDSDVEEDETFNITFSNPARSVELLTDVLTGTIRNDDDMQATVIATAPTANALDVLVNATTVITFSEAVSVTAGVTMICDGEAQTIALAMTGAMVLEITPANALPHGESCIITVPANSVQDDDNIDPPDGLAADFTLTFTTAIADSPDSGQLLITQYTYQADPGDGMPNGALDGFIIVKNVGTTALSLDGYKLGDEETQGGDEGMFALPDIMLGAGDQIIIAEDADFYAFSTPADYSFADNSASIPNLTAFTGWSSGAVDLDDSSDEVVLLGSDNTLVDGSCYGVADEECVLDTTARVQRRILNDGRLGDTDNFAGFVRDSDVDTDVQADWEQEETAVSFVAASAKVTSYAVGLAGIVLLTLTVIAVFVGSRFDPKWLVIRVR